MSQEEERLEMYLQEDVGNDVRCFHHGLYACSLNSAHPPVSSEGSEAIALWKSVSVAGVS